MPPRRNPVRAEGEGNAGNDGQQEALNRMLEMMQQQQQLHAEQMRQLLAINQQPAAPLRNGAVERFRKMNPQEFGGGVDPMIAEEWVKSLEMVFEYLQFTDNERVSCAIFMLTKDARTWWEGTRLTVDVPALTWERFKEIFYNKYFTADVRARKIQEFLELKQNGMSVCEYVRRFEQGCRFVPFIAGDEGLKKDQFLMGLNPRIRSMVRMSVVNTFPELVDKAMLADEDRKAIVKEIKQKKQNSKSSTSSGPVKRAPFRNFNREGGLEDAKVVRATPYVSRPVTARPPKCNKCGRFHIGECPPDSRICYNCHQIGHVSYNCPMGQSSDRKKTPARVFTMTRGEADKKEG